VKSVAWIGLRAAVHYRMDAFWAGFAACDFEPRVWEPGAQMRAGDVLCIWNRMPSWEPIAQHATKVGCAVLVAENGYLGKNWQGGNWYALALDYHNGPGRWPLIPGRWQQIGEPVRPARPMPLRPRVLLLPQRGIGPQQYAMPPDWAETVRRRVQAALGYDVSVRPHPGKGDHTDALLEALEAADVVVTHGSGAAVKAMLWGWPVVHTMPKWIAAAGSTPLETWLRDGVLGPMWPAGAVFERMAGALWRLEEIASGVALREVLACR
jgi:hypothetical protein